MARGGGARARSDYLGTLKLRDGVEARCRLDAHRARRARHMRLSRQVKCRKAQAGRAGRTLSGLGPIIWWIRSTALRSLSWLSAVTLRTSGSSVVQSPSGLNLPLAATVAPVSENICQFASRLKIRIQYFKARMKNYLLKSGCLGKHCTILAVINIHVCRAVSVI